LIGESLVAVSFPLYEGGARGETNILVITFKHPFFFCGEKNDRKLFWPVVKYEAADIKFFIK
jgi:hypothetical protein